MSCAEKPARRIAIIAHSHGPTNTEALAEVLARHDIETIDDADLIRDEPQLAEDLAEHILGMMECRATLEPYRGQPERYHPTSPRQRGGR